MNVKQDPVESSHRPNGHAARRANGRGGRGDADLLRRARDVVRGLPSRLEAQLKRNPYAVLGVACAVGTGVGIVLSSRILRAAFTATATAAALELLRSLVHDEALPGDA
jgi:hypothetical protein